MARASHSALVAFSSRFSKHNNQASFDSELDTQSITLWVEPFGTASKQIDFLREVKICVKKSEVKQRKMASSMTDFNLNTAVTSPIAPGSTATPTGSSGSPSAASATAAAAAASLIHSASQINDQLTSFSSLAQYGAAAAGFTQLAASPADSLYSASAASSSLDNGVMSGVSPPTSSSTLTSGLTSGLTSAAAATSAAATSIASFGFTQEQVACVCEVLEQSGNIDRLAR